MPTENEKPSAAPAATVPDTRDAEIAKLKLQLEQTGKENDALAQDLEAARKKLKERNTVPAGDYCVLKGKTYQIAGTVPCKFATDEGRKGHIDLEADLVILKR